MYKKVKNNKAFTLIELIVVVGIIGILVGIASPKFTGFTKDADVAAMKSDTRVLEDAADMYYINNESWPIKGNPISNHNIHGVSTMYQLDESKVNDSVKNISNDYDEYGIAVDGSFDGKVFHLDGIKGKNYEVTHGHSVKFPSLDNVAERNETPGVNLVRNGDGRSKDNTNFSQLKYNGKEVYNGLPSFTHEGRHKDILSNELIPINTGLKYEFSYSIKSRDNTGNSTYGMIAPYDIDGNIIRVSNHMYVSGTTTKLKEDLMPGDEYIYLESTDNWINDDKGTRRLIFWDYKDSTGYKYPKETYSRNVSDENAWNAGAVDSKSNKVKLNKRWSGKVKKAGTYVSNGDRGAIYKYIPGYGYKNTNKWTEYKGVISGLDSSGRNRFNMFPPGTRYVKVGWLLNHNEPVSDKVYISNIGFEVIN